MKTVIGINGACGRMGQRIAQLAHEDKDLAIGAALETVGHPMLGNDIGEVAGFGKIGVMVHREVQVEHNLDAIIDFSTPEGTMTVLPACLARKIALVVATTGHTAKQKADIEEAAHDIAILATPNTSLGVNVLMNLVALGAKMLRNKGFDVEVLERHHRYKKDSPSGTALQIARVIQEAMGQTQLRHGREGLVGERPPHEIGIHALRVGDNVGEHTVIFSTLGETVELTHRAHARDCYARGALQAAKFLAGRPAGRYTMNDVLGL
jgi:4-hydroxy-tetrahydrodipicolinate reductase